MQRRVYKNYSNLLFVYFGYRDYLCVNGVNVILLLACFNGSYAGRHQWASLQIK